MKQLAKKVLATALIAVMLTFSVGCNSWPTIIATAQAMADVTTIFYPQVGALSALSVSLLQQADAAYVAYQANKNDGTAAAYVAAIQAIETQLPADLAALNLPAQDQQRITAVVNIILDFVEAEAGQVPVTASLVLNSRSARHAGDIKRMSRSEIKYRWRTEVCHNNTKCVSLVK